MASNPYPIKEIFIIRIIHRRSRRGSGAQACNSRRNACGFDSHSGGLNIWYFHFLVLVTRQSAAMRYAAHNAMPQEFGAKWGTAVFMGMECLDTRFPGPLCIRYGTQREARINIHVIVPTSVLHACFQVGGKWNIESYVSSRMISKI